MDEATGKIVRTATDNTFTIAITGCIGSGKSFVCRRLEERWNVKIYDCDSAAKRLMAESAELREALTNLIGPDTYVDGKLNKPVVAKFLLASKSNKNAINNIVHPAVEKDFHEYCNRVADSNMFPSHAWMECAILYESGFYRLANRVVAVVAPEDVRVERIMKRDGITAEKAREWIAQQWPQEEVARRAHIVINNDGKQDLDSQIDDIVMMYGT